MKVAIIGAGNVGSTSAMRIAEKGLADVVMVDIKQGLARAKALDISDSAHISTHEFKITGSENFSEIKGAAIVAVTAGLSRKPGMKREELLSKNKEIIQGVAGHIKKHAPKSIVIVVTNPLDVMSYIMLKECGFSKKKVLGMAGDLDTSRFIGLVAEELGAKTSEIAALVMGSHGETMVPVISKTTISGRSIRELLSKEAIEGLVSKTKRRGAEIVSLLKQGSAYYAPSAAVADLTESILTNRKRVHCVSACLNGEYDLKDIFIGVPAVIGEAGVEEILDVDLTEEEKKAFERSAEAVKANIALLKSKKE